MSRNITIKKYILNLFLHCRRKVNSFTSFINIVRQYNASFIIKPHIYMYTISLNALALILCKEIKKSLNKKKYFLHKKFINFFRGKKIRNSELKLNDVKNTNEAQFFWRPIISFLLYGFHGHSLA